jgi:hypothetical protein|tara:strand:+ start:160 stop:360 length:201 start_codon:yes stop_codon:yes gene_type:complete
MNKRTDIDIIDEIQSIRSKNNINWMNILKIAFKYAPEETRKVFKNIAKEDNSIIELSNELANNKLK